MMGKYKVKTAVVDLGRMHRILEERIADLEARLLEMEAVITKSKASDGASTASQSACVRALKAWSVAPQTVREVATAAGVNHNTMTTLASKMKSQGLVQVVVSETPVGRGRAPQVLTISDYGRRTLHKMEDTK